MDILYGVNCMSIYFQLFLASFFPLIFGGLRFVKNLGTFDLFIYSHRKLWKYGKHHEKFEEENEKIAPASTPELGSYYEYRNSRNVFPSCAGPVLAGSLYLILSLFLTLCTLQKALHIFVFSRIIKQFTWIIIVLNLFLHSL